MAYRVELTPDARKSLKRVSADVRERIVLALYLLGQTPRPPGVKKLSNQKDIHRIVWETIWLFTGFRTPCSWCLW